MRRILVTGASGQIGSELVPALRESYGAENVIAGRHSRPLTDETTEGGPSAEVDVTDRASLAQVVKSMDIDSIYHLGSVLSAAAERERDRSHAVNVTGLINVLEVAAQHSLERVILPSSIGAFGPDTPRDNTPNDTIQRPTSLYGIAKVFGELMGNYYSESLGLDVRGVRLPGIMSWKVEPTSGTTDYAVAAFYGAVRNGRYTCYLNEGTYLPMMYMPDAVSALMQVAEADRTRLRHHADFNVNAMSFAPEELAGAIKERMPEFRMDFEIDPVRQAIADSWPNSLDDSVARQEWDWRPRYGLSEVVDDMLENLERKLLRE